MTVESDRLSAVPSFAKLEAGKALISLYLKYITKLYELNKSLLVMWHVCQCSALGLSKSIWDSGFLQYDPLSNDVEDYFLENQYFTDELASLKKELGKVKTKESEPGTGML